MKSHTNQTFLTLTSVLAFFPFVSPYPIGSDLQPVFFMLACISLFAKRDRIKLGLAPAFFPLLVLALAYFQNLDNWHYFDFLRFSFALIAYLFFLNFPQQITQKLLFYVSSIWLGLLLLNTISPSFFITLFGSVLVEIRSQEISIRGAAGLAPEPGFAGLIAVGVFNIAAFKRDIYGKNEYFWAIFCISLICVALTRSGTGGLYFVLFCALYFMRLRQLPHVLGILLLFVLILNYVEVGRAGEVLRALFADPMLAVQLDRSIGTRVLNAAIGFVAVFDSPFGYGFDDHLDQSAKIASKYGLYAFVSGDIGWSSNFGRYSVHLGLFWWLFIIVMFIVPAVLGKERIWIFCLMAFIFSAFSVSIAFPLTWALVGLCHSRILYRPRHSINRGHLQEPVGT